MKLKSKVRLALELVLVTSMLPLLLLGCGGGGGSSASGPMTGQYWTDLTGAGIRYFTPNSNIRGEVDTATFSAGNYNLTYVNKTLSGGVWSTVNNSNTAYYLSASGWTTYPSTLTISPTTQSSFTASYLSLGSVSAMISTVNLSGTPIVASSAVPAVDAQGNSASWLSPASAIYPAGSYEYDMTSSFTTATPAYYLYADFPVTTVTGSPTPITVANFNASSFAAHASKADPICFEGLLWVHKTGSTYDAYIPTMNAGTPSGTLATCQNSTIGTSTASFGTYDLSFGTVNGVSIVTISNPTGGFAGSTGATSIIAILPALNAVYWGFVIPAGSSVSTSYALNKTAMDAALTAWGVPTF